MAYKPSPTKTEGGQKETRTSDDNTQQLLARIVKELKIMNVHLSIITDNYITDQETDNG